MGNRLESATTLADLADVALDAGLSAVLDEPAGVILKDSKVSGVLRATVTGAIEHLPDGSLGALLQEGSQLLAGRDMKGIRGKLLSLARAHLIAALAAGTAEVSQDEPPKSRTALEAWARDHHVREYLDWTVLDAVRHTGSLDSYIYPFSSHRLGALAVGAFKAQRTDRRVRDQLKVDAWGFLRWRAGLVARGLAEERDKMRVSPDLLEEPVARQVAETFLRTRAKIRESVMPLPKESPGSSKLRFHDEVPPRLTYSESGRRFRSKVIVDVSILGADRVAAHTLCGCRVDPCIHVLNAVDFVLRMLVQGKPKTTYRRLLNAVSHPAWRRELDEIEKLVTREKRSNLTTVEETVPWWQIAQDHRGFSIVPYLQKRGKKGQPLQPRKVSWERLSEHRNPGWSRADRILAENGDSLAPRRYRQEHTGPVARCEAAARALIGHPRVFIGDAFDSPVEVRESRATLVAQRGAEGVELLPGIDGEPAASSFEDTQDLIGDLLVDLDVEARRCRITSGTRLLAKVGELHRRFGGVIPYADVGYLGRLLPNLEPTLTVVVPDSLKGQRIESERRLVLRLQPIVAGGGLHVEALVRAHPNGVLFAPGDGPAEVLGPDQHEQLSFAPRDLGSEPDWALRLLGGLLELPELGGSPKWSWDLESLDEALAFVQIVQARDEIVCEWPRENPWRVFGTAQIDQLRIKIDRRADWFGLDGEVDVDGEKVKLALLLQAARANRSFVEIEEGRWVAIAVELRERLQRLEPMVLERRSGMEVSGVAADAVCDLADGAVSVEACAEWDALVERLASSVSRNFKPAKSLNVELRDYQVEGFRWLSRLATWGVGACLADDMGLGKTVQALAVLIDRADGPALVVAPTSVCFNWAREVQRFAPRLHPVVYAGRGRRHLLGKLGPGDLLITSYTLATRDQVVLREVAFKTLVLDEAQAIKNATTQRARAMRDLSAEWRVALTGTPIENHLGELWSLFRVLSPGLFGSWERFRGRFAQPIEQAKDEECAHVLSRTIKPFVLRRTKGEVAQELPERTEIELPIELSAGERRLYDNVRLDAIASFSEAGAEETRFKVLAALTRLRQVACSPRLYDEKSKLPSSKLERLLEMLEPLLQEGRRALVFSQFVRHLALVRAALDRAEIPYLYLDGSTPAAQRSGLIDRFQGGAAPLFLISLKAGGFGLNLTAADTVFHLDPWWNPAVEDQASDRAHRIGQKKPVTIYRLITHNTIEQAIMTLHSEKRALVAKVLAGTDSAGKLSTEDLVALIREGTG
ncbi:DEAD/DEAH box helicase [Myxococcota bacterium]